MTPAPLHARERRPRLIPHSTNRWAARHVIDNGLEGIGLALTCRRATPQCR